MPDLGEGGEDGQEMSLQSRAAAATREVWSAVESLRVNNAVETALELVRASNRFLERQAPWKLVRDAATRNLAGAA